MNDLPPSPADFLGSKTRLCPTHGLRFDPSTTAGCIRCRSSAPPPPVESAARVKVLGVILLALVVGGVGWFAHDRLSLPKQEDSRFTDEQRIAEARRVRVVIYSATWCPSCDAAKSFLWKHDVPFEEHDIDKEKDARDRWVLLNPKKTIPLIDVEGDLVVGADPEAMVRALLKAAERHLAAAEPSP